MLDDYTPEEFEYACRHAAKLRQVRAVVSKVSAAYCRDQNWHDEQLLERIDLQRGVILRLIDELLPCVDPLITPPSCAVDYFLFQDLEGIEDA